MYAVYKAKIKNLFSLTRLMALAVLFLLVVLSLSSPLEAQTAFTQGYGADEALQRGMIVRLKTDDPTKVVPLIYDEIETMHGVVVNSNDAPVTLSAEGQNIFVATGGKYDVLVSDQNGPIKSGDYLTISAVTGIGMKAGGEETLAVGRAVSDFDGKTGVIGTAEVKDTAGKAQMVNFGRVAGDIAISRNPLYGPSSSGLPRIVVEAAEDIADKPVNTFRVYIALAILVISTIVAGTMMYGGVRSAIISIGRNPLSKKSIIRSMLQVVLLGFIIFILGLFGVYLLLKL